VQLLLSRCNMITPKAVELSVPSCHVTLAVVMEVVERIRSKCYLNNKVQFNVLSRCKR
jgi:hypothetical protein